MALTDKLTNIADAVRSKTMTNDKMSLNEMITKIKELKIDYGENPAPLEISNLSYFNRDNHNKELIQLCQNLGIKLKCSENNSELYFSFYDTNSCPFNELFLWSSQTSAYLNAQYCFQNYKGNNIPIIHIFISNTTGISGALNSMFSNSTITKMPEIKFNTDFFLTGNWQLGGMFQICRYLRDIPIRDIKPIYVNNTDYACSQYFITYYLANEDYTLNQLVDIPFAFGVKPILSNGNAFENMVDQCYMLKHLTFDTSFQTEKPKNIINQTIDCSTVGYTDWAKMDVNSSYYDENTNQWESDRGQNIFSRIYLQIDYIPAIYDNETYNQWKDDPNRFATLEYAIYNKESAIETMRTLPDLSDESNHDNTIIFKGDAGSALEMGAINTMTDEEIAIATEKGWTVSFI